MKSIILHDYFHVQDDEMVEFSLSVWAVAALKPKNVNTKLCLLFLLHIATWWLETAMKDNNLEFTRLHAN